MTIETKYNIGDEVWTIIKSKAQKLGFLNLLR